MYCYIVGLALNMTFDDGEYRGRIFNTLDEQNNRREDLGRRLTFDDYILVTEEARCSR